MLDTCLSGPLRHKVDALSCRGPPHLADAMHNKDKAVDWHSGSKVIGLL